MPDSRIEKSPLLQWGFTHPRKSGVLVFVAWYCSFSIQGIDIEFGKLYSQLIDWRQESDYAEFVDFNEEDVAPLMIKVKEFNSILVELLGTK